MSRNSTLGRGAALAALALAGVVAAGLPGPTRAALPPGGASAPPLITDRLHHLSGVIAVPPARMMAAVRPAAPGFGLLTPPTFGPNVDASLNNAAAQNETTIAINPEDDQRVIAAANDYRANLKPYVYLSTDGGANWVNYAVPGVNSALYYGDPAMAFDTSGRAYFANLGYQSVCGGQGGMYVSRSTDAGASFSAPLQLAANSNNGVVAVLQDKEYVTVDTAPASPYLHNAYQAWTRYAFTAGANCGDPSTQLDASIVLSRSTDQGLSWSTPITASPPISTNNQAAVPVAGRHGEVYLYYLGAQTQSQLNYDSVLFSRSTDGGQTFPFFTHIASMVDLPSPLPHTSFRNNGFGAMAADPQIDGYLYAVWADYRTGDADILLSRSTDNGTTWGAPQRVNDDPAGNGKDQFFPWIATSPDGRVHIAWFDRRDDPNDANYHEYYADSLDHGATFEPNVRVSTAPSIPGSSPFIGDYSGLAATNGVVMPIWTDIRNGANQNAYVARGVFAVATPTSTPPPTETPTAPPFSTATATATSTATASATVAPPTATPAAPSPTRTVTATATACAIRFSDVQPADYFYTPVQYLACHGVVSGYADGTFRPYNQTTRSQMVKIVVLGFNAPPATPTPGGYTFADVPPANPFFGVIETAAARNIVSGYACGGPGEPCDAQNRPYFRPYANVTRGQLAKIVVVAAGWQVQNPAAGSFADVAPNTAFYTFVETAYCHGVISGYTCGGPGEPCDSQNRPYYRQYNNATRGQIAKIVYGARTGAGACAAP